MWFSKQDELELPKLPPSRKEKGVLELFRKSLKKIEIPKSREEPDILKKLDLGENEKGIDPDFYFWLCDGRVVKDVKELTAVMRNMKEDVFEFHVSGQKNDFSNWVRDVVKDDKLGQELNNAKTSEEAYEILSGEKLKKKKQKKIASRMKAAEQLRIEKAGGAKEEAEEIVKESAEEVAEEGAEKQELEGREAWEEEEEALESIEEVIEKPAEALLPYKGGIIPKPGKEKGIRGTFKISAIEEDRERIKSETRKTKPRGMDKINKLLEEAGHSISHGDAEAAKALMKKARSMLKKSSMPKDEKRKLNYKIVETETGAKLLTLS